MLKLEPQWDFLLSSQRMLTYGHLAVSVLLKDGRRFDGMVLNSDGNLATPIRDRTGRLIHFDNDEISQIEPWPALPDPRVISAALRSQLLAQPMTRPNCQVVSVVLHNGKRFDGLAVLHFLDESLITHPTQLGALPFKGVDVANVTVTHDKLIFERMGLLPLSEKWQTFLSNQPESGMGYQVVTVVLKDGRRFDRIGAYGSYLGYPSGSTPLPFKEEDIADIIVTHHRG